MSIPRGGTMASGALHEATHRLEERGHRVTAQRIAVLTSLLTQRGGITAQALHARLRQNAPRLGLATVYRTLELLVEAGLAERLFRPNSEVCYAYCSAGHHHHVICVCCGLIVELPGCPLPAVQRQVERQAGFSIAYHSLTFYGTCQPCQAREAAVLNSATPSARSP